MFRIFKNDRNTTVDSGERIACHIRNRTFWNTVVACERLVDLINAELLVLEIDLVEDNLDGLWRLLKDTREELHEDARAANGRDIHRHDVVERIGVVKCFKNSSLSDVSRHIDNNHIIHLTKRRKEAVGEALLETVNFKRNLNTWENIKPSVRLFVNVARNNRNHALWRNFDYPTCVRVVVADFLRELRNGKVRLKVEEKVNVLANEVVLNQADTIAVVSFGVAILGEDSRKVGCERGLTRAA